MRWEKFLDLEIDDCNAPVYREWIWQGLCLNLMLFETALNRLENLEKN